MKTKKENSEQKSEKDKFLPEEILSSSKQMTRRSFISAFGRVVGLGIVVSKTAVFAASAPQDPNAPCLFGLPAEDLCTTKENDTCISGSIHTDECIKGGDSDRCPGNAEPDDSCPTGAKTEDNCLTNREPEDVCPPPGANEVDNCETGQPAEDVCPFPGDEKNDRCYTGLKSDDICGTPPYRFSKNGGPGSDECPGGGDFLNRKELDFCKPEYEEGDKCSDATVWFGNEDDCKESDPDECTKFDDDTCIYGVLTNDGADHSDLCDTLYIPIIGQTLASDQCNDGRNDQDICEQNGGNFGEHDTCPGGGIDVDICSWKSDDYCNSSNPNSDECYIFDRGEDEDICPSGKSGDDICYTTIRGDDICFDSQTDACPRKTNDYTDACDAFGSFKAQDTCNPGFRLTDKPE